MTVAGSGRNVLAEVGVLLDDRLRRRAYRARSWLLCHSGLHLWARRRNPEVGGAAALFDECRRCGSVRMDWDAPGRGPFS